jgi:hypothetical protein
MTARPRCGTCYRPLGVGPHVCPPERAQPAPAARTRKPAPTVNRRRNPQSRAEYLAAVTTSAEHKRELGRQRQAAYRAKRREVPGQASCDAG